MKKEKPVYKVALNAAMSQNTLKRIMYAAYFRGESVRAPSGGVIIQGYPYQAGELIPASAIQTAEKEERDNLFNLIEEDKKALASRKPGPGQETFPGMNEPSQDEKDQQRRENARSFTPLDLITHRGINNDHKPYYGAIYDWLMNHFRDWYENLSDDQQAQATSFGRRIKIAGEMNPYLRRKHGSYDHNSYGIEEGIRVFDSLVDEAPPIEQDTITYRGISDLASLGGVANVKKGNIVPINTYMSSSIDPGVATGSFMSSHNPESVLMRILLPKGTRVAPVTAYNIHKAGTGRTGFMNGNGPHESELTLPRDSKLRIVSEPHEETFSLGRQAGTNTIRVADFELVPQPTPEESPELPHEPIHSWDTGGYEDFGGTNRRPYDPWENRDPYDMKSDKTSELETLIEDYEQNPAHDDGALKELNDLKDELDSEDHNDYSEPDEFDNAMDMIISKANKVINEAPDHTDELWEEFNPTKEREIDSYLHSMDFYINEFANKHDTNNPVAAEALSNLNTIRKQISAYKGTDAKDVFDFPTEFMEAMTKKVDQARKVIDLAHEVYGEQISGKPPLFLGKEAELSDMTTWMNLKKLFDGHMAWIKINNPEVADRLQTLWDKASHSTLPGYDANQLLQQIEFRAKKIIEGNPPEWSGYGYKALPELEKDVDHKAMVDRSVLANIEKARGAGLFQGKEPPKGYLMEWAKKLNKFNKDLNEYINKKQDKGEPISPDATKLQELWDRATKELPPGYVLNSIMENIISLANNLKEGQTSYYTTIENTEKDIHGQILHSGTPEGIFKAKLLDFNNQYTKAYNNYENSSHFDADHANFVDLFNRYLKTKGIDKVTEIGTLPPEDQNEIFTQAHKLIANIKSATLGHIEPQNIWLAPGNTAGKTAIGLPGLFQGQQMPYGYTKKWLTLKNQFDGHIKDLENKGYNNPDKDPERVEKLKDLWYSVTHNLPPDNFTHHLMDMIGVAARDLSNGFSVDYAISDLKHNYQDSLASNPLPASQAPPDIFMGQTLPTGYADKWLTHKDDFQNSIEKFKKKFSVTDGSSIGSETEKLEKLWHAITHDLPPDDHTAHLMGMLIDTAHKMPDLPYASGDLISRMVSVLKESVSKEIAAQAKTLPESTQATRGVPSKQEMVEKALQFKYKSEKDKLLKEYGNIIFNYGSTPHYSNDYHHKLNTMLNKTLENYPDGEEQNAILKAIVFRAQYALDDKPNAGYIVNAPLQSWTSTSGAQVPVTKSLHEPDSTIGEDLALKKSFPDEYDQYVKNMNEYEGVPHFDMAHSNKLSNLFSTVSKNWSKKKDPDYTKNDFDALLGLTDQAVKKGHILPSGKFASEQEPEPESEKDILLGQYKQAMDAYIGSPHYNKSHHHAINSLMDIALKHVPEGEKQIGSLKKLVNRARNLADHKGWTDEDPDMLKVVPEGSELVSKPPKDMSTKEWHELYRQKVEEFRDAKNQYAGHSGYDPNVHAELSNNFWGNKYPMHVSMEFSAGNAQHKQLTIERFDKAINKAKALIPVSEKEPRPSKSEDYVALSEQFPEHVSKFVKNIDHYQDVPHHDPEHSRMLKDIFYDVARFWNKNKDPKTTRYDLEDLVNMSEQALVAPPAPRVKTSNVLRTKSEEVPTKLPVKTPEEHTEPPGASPEPPERPGPTPPRITYEGFIRHIQYARKRRIQYAADQSQEELIPEHPHWREALVFNHAHDILGPGRDPNHVKDIYDWEVNHYKNWHDAMEPDERKIAGLGRPVKISAMNRHLRSNSSNAEREALLTNGWSINRGMQTLDSLIRTAPKLPRDMIVYRGIASKRPLFSDNKPGDIIPDSAYASSTPDLETARRFSIDTESGRHSHIMRILLPKGTRAAGVTASQIIGNNASFEQVRDNPGRFEHELVLPRGSQYKVLSHPYVKHINAKRYDGSTVVIPHTFIDVEHMSPSHEESPRATYESFVRHVQYARKRRIRYAAEQSQEDPTPEYPHWGGALTLNHMHDMLGPMRDRSHLKGIYDWEVNHYKNWHNAMEPDGRQMASWQRPMKITAMNRYLRGDSSAEKERSSFNGWSVHRGIQAMDHLIRTAPKLTTDMIAYRGIASKTPLFTDKKPGDIIPDKAYSSSTPDLETARKFSVGDEVRPHSYILRMLLPKGTRAAGVTGSQILRNYVSEQYAYDNPQLIDHELVLPRDSQYKVMSHPYTKNLQIRRADGSIVVKPHTFIDVEHMPKPEFGFTTPPPPPRKAYYRMQRIKVALNNLVK